MSPNQHFTCQLLPFFSLPQSPLSLKHWVLGLQHKKFLEGGIVKFNSPEHGRAEVREFILSVWTVNSVKAYFIFWKKKILQ